MLNRQLALARAVKQRSLFAKEFLATTPLAIAVLEKKKTWEENALVKALKWNQKALDKKRTFFREEKIMGKWGLEKAFRISKWISVIDIAQEKLSFFMGASYIAAVSAVEMSGYSKANNFALFWLTAVYVGQAGLGWLGTGLDILQHLLVDSIAHTFPKLKREEAIKLYEAFAHESIREQALDNIAKHNLIPLIGTFRRFVAVKSEKLQRQYIEQMHGLLGQKQGNA